LEPLPAVDFGLAWRIGTNESLVDELDRLILGLQEDGTVSQVCCTRGHGQQALPQTSWPNTSIC